LRIHVVANGVDLPIHFKKKSQCSSECPVCLFLFY
jgi:hypothetical protein